MTVALRGRSWQRCKALRSHFRSTRSFSAGEPGEHAGTQIVCDTQTPQVMANTCVAEASRAVARNTRGETLVRQQPVATKLIEHTLKLNRI